MVASASTLLFAVLAVLLGLVGGLFGAGLVLRNAGPVATRGLLADTERLRLDWIAWRTGADSVLESVQDVEEVIERKRRRVAARESVEKARESATPIDARTELRLRARAMGHPV